MRPVWRSKANGRESKILKGAAEFMQKKREAERGWVLLTLKGKAKNK